MSLLTNLISYWKLDEASGTRSDSHSTNSLTDNNTVGSATGKINTAADFESDNGEYLSVADNDSLSVENQSWTFAAWVKPESLGYQGVAAKVSSTLVEWRLGYYSGFPGLYLDTGTAGDRCISGYGALSVGTWYHVVCWYDDASKVAGISVNAGTATTNSAPNGIPASTAGPFVLGTLVYDGSGQCWDGLIDEAGLWKRVLTSQERTDLYNGGSGLAYSSFGGGGGSPITVTPPTASLTLTKYAPTILTPRVVTPPTKTLTTTKFAPVIKLAVIPPNKALSLASFAPAIRTPRVVTPPTKALTTTKFAPVVGLGIVPPTKALTLTKYAPTIMLPRLVTPPALALVLTKYAPNVSATSGLTCVPPTKALVITAYAPSVVLPRLVTPPTLALIISKFAPSVLTPRVVVPPTKSLVITRYAPTVTVASFSIVITPPTLTLVLTTYAPTVTGSTPAVPERYTIHYLELENDGLALTQLTPQASGYSLVTLDQRPTSNFTELSKEDYTD